MRIEQYQGLAMRTSTEGHDRIMNGCLGLVGESGEIVDVVKKWKFQSGDHAALPVEKLIDECGDVLWYCAELATGLEQSLYSLYERLWTGFWEDMTPMNEGQPLEIIAYRLVYAALQPFCTMYEIEENDEDWRHAAASANVVGIMVMVRFILETFCGSTLEEAMERNIEKLKRRYLDGFDPERSLHRAE